MHKFNGTNEFGFLNISANKYAIRMKWEENAAEKMLFSVFSSEKVLFIWTNERFFLHHFLWFTRSNFGVCRIHFDDCTRFKFWGEKIEIVHFFSGQSIECRCQFVNGAWPPNVTSANRFSRFSWQFQLQKLLVVNLTLLSREHNGFSFPFFVHLLFASNHRQLMRAICK